MSKFETYLSWSEFRWRLTTNWIIVWASSEWFHSESYCIENAKKVMVWIYGYLEENNKLENKIISPNWLPIKKKINLFDFSNINKLN